MESPLILVASDLDFDCWIEEHEGRTWVHHNVFRWNHKVYARVLQTLGWLQQHLNRDLWVCEPDPEVNRNHAKYMQRLGFVPSEVIAHNGRDRVCYIRELEHG